MRGNAIAADVLDPDHSTEGAVIDLAIDPLDVMNIDTEDHQIVVTNVGMIEETTMVVEEIVDLVVAIEAVKTAIQEGTNE